MDERYRGNAKLFYAELESNDYKEVPAIEDIKDEITGGLGNEDIWDRNCSIEKYNYRKIEQKNIKKLKRRVNKFYKKIKKCPYCKQTPTIKLENGFCVVFCSTYACDNKNAVIAYGRTIAETIKEWNKYWKKEKRGKD